MTALEEDRSETSVCVCGQPDLRYLYTITNELNGAVLFPIGSVCINKFGRDDLDEQVNLLSEVLKLRGAILDGKQIELDSRYFSRNLLGYLYDEGAITPDQWNKGHVAGDYDFLLRMFNKRNKHEISQGQRNKIRALLRTKIIPFVLAHHRLN